MRRLADRPAGGATARRCGGRRRAGRPAASAHRRTAPRTAEADRPTSVGRRVDVLQVSGLFDDIVVDAIDDAIDARRRAAVAGARPPGQLPRRRRRATTRWPSCSSASPTRRCRSASGSVRRARACTARRHRCSRVADVTGMAPGAASATPAAPLESTSDEDRLSVLAGSTDAARRLARPVRRARARCVQAAHHRRGHPDDPQHGRCARRLRGGRDVARHHHRGVDRRRHRAARDDRLVRFSKLEPARPADPHGRQPRRRLPAVPRSGWRCSCSSSSRPASASPAWSGAVCTFFACYGLAALPARWWAVGLIVLAMLAFAVDVQVGIPRFWTGVGIVLTIVGSCSLFEPLPGTSLRPSWLTLLAGIGGMMLAFIVGMPSMVRTRFATPTIGREWMIGETGSVVERRRSRRRRPGRHGADGGRARTGRRRSRPASGCGSSRSTASRSRSNRSRARPATTARCDRSPDQTPCGGPGTTPSLAAE